ncbi:MAG: hypothetical protein Q7J34_10005 [Bacteroidales bacterium]|nr:hypothetical protein [Bacteroidales bacterium]
MVWGTSSLAQSPCNASTPTHNVNLSSSSTAVWNSGSIVRDGNCCSGTLNNCVLFLVSVHPNSGGVILQVYEGGVPVGSMTYSSSCGTTVAVGSQMCLTGSGPHTIFFCKPGSNANTYIITSFPKPNLIAPEVKVNQNCSASLWVEGYVPGSVNWTSIYPGTAGQYNSYLSCTNCSNPVFTPGLSPPTYIDYQVSGVPVSTCNLIYSLPLRVYINPARMLSISPLNPSICNNGISVTLTAQPSGGSPPYIYLWNTGEITQSILATPGNYSCAVTDQSLCTSTIANSLVSINATAVSINAGADIETCYNVSAVPLNATVEIATGGQWIGGLGSFIPSRNSLTPIYYPTNAEKLVDSLPLIIQTTGNGFCSPVNDTIILYFQQKPLTSNILHN